jgi:hypothetical protein
MSNKRIDELNDRVPDPTDYLALSPVGGPAGKATIFDVIASAAAAGPTGNTGVTGTTGVTGATGITGA